MGDTHGLRQGLSNESGFDLIRLMKEPKIFDLIQH
jgi:hypothetical protein